MFSHHGSLLRTLLSILALAALLVTAPAFADELGLKDLGAAPDFELPVYGGETMKLSELLKKGPVMVDFWATWCGPCRVALPTYEAIYQKYRDEGFTIVAISEDHPRSHSKIGSFVSAHELSFPVLLDATKEVAAKYGVSSLPTSFLISSDGRVMAADVGFRPGDEGHLARRIAALLELKSGPDINESR